VNCSNCGRFVDDGLARATRNRCPHCGGRLRSGRAGSALRDSRGLRILVGFAVTTFVVLLLVTPAARALRYSSMRTDTLAQLAAIRLAEKAYREEWGVYLAADPTPDRVPNGDIDPFIGSGLDAFQQLGWAPANVRCRYRVLQVSGHGDVEEDWFEATAECDTDGDGERALYRTTAQRKPYRDSRRDIY
jgi:hypothetical protein